MKRHFGLTVLLVLGMFLPGCGEGDSGEPQKDKYVPVSGIVTLDGEPLSNASVQFLPQAGGDAKSAYYGVTGLDGKFDLASARGTPGAEPGSYTVVISKFAQQDGSPLPADADAADFAALGMEHLPPRYSDPNSTELRAIVPQGGKSDISFPLKK